jgi:hypothetical protein
MKGQGGQIMEIRKAQKRIGPQHGSKNPEKEVKIRSIFGFKTALLGTKRILQGISELYILICEYAARTVQKLA